MDVFGLHIKKLYVEHGSKVIPECAELLKQCKKHLYHPIDIPSDAHTMSIPYTLFDPFDEEELCDQTIEIFSQLQCPPDSQHRLIKLRVLGENIQKKIDTLKYTFHLILMFNELVTIRDQVSDYLLNIRKNIQKLDITIHHQEREKIQVCKHIFSFFTSGFAYFLYLLLILCGGGYFLLSSLPFVIPKLFLVVGFLISFFLLILAFSIIWLRDGWQQKHLVIELKEYLSEQKEQHDILYETMKAYNDIVSLYRKQLQQNAQQLKHLFGYKQPIVIEQYLHLMQVDEISEHDFE